MTDKLYIVNAQAINDCMKAASKEETRYYLGGVYIHDKDGQRHYVGTDGHIMVHISEKLVGDEELKEGLILKPCTKIKIGKRRDYADLAGTIQIIDKDTVLFKDNYQKIVFDIIDGNYPDYTRVVPEENTPKLKDYTAFNANYLKIVQSLTGKVEQPQGTDNASPAMWINEVGDLQYQIVLMPMRI